MVLIWNDLSGGDREAAAVLVAVNSLFQVVAFAFLGYFYLKVLPGWLGLSTVGLHLSVGGSPRPSPSSSAFPSWQGSSPAPSANDTGAGNGINHRCHLGPLSKDEVINYVNHRLEVARGRSDLFSDDALNSIYKYSGGSPG